MPTIDQLIRASQSKLVELGYPIGTVDGVDGVKTWTAIAQHLGAKTSQENAPATVPDGDRVDDRSERAIKTLHEKVQPLARELVRQSAAKGITIKITSGTRTYAEQDKLFDAGGVTKARGGYSNHNFGLAFDVTIFDENGPVWESPKYRMVGQIGKSLGLSWGGDWAGFVDEPHFELRPRWAANISESKMLAELRRRREVSMDPFA